MCQVDFADLAIIDLSEAHTPAGRARLAPQLRDALRINGFVYAINHGYTQVHVSLIVLLPSNHSFTLWISVIGFSTLDMCRLQLCLPKK
jgi:isopenicillin N synthase-like dioxygenase